jgi:hypothetical protein
MKINIKDFINKKKKKAFFYIFFEKPLVVEKKTNTNIKFEFISMK